MKKIIHKSESRGHANHGWLNSCHSFSFAGYNNPERIHFGALRVLNDDEVSGGMGFGSHPHDNMEIISIPTSGALEHRDNTGTASVIREGDVQVMSAGTGIVHSEKNNSANEGVKFFQIWVFPNKKNVQPRYQQMNFTDEQKHNKLLTVVSPIGTNDGGVQIHQDAWFTMGNIDKGTKLDYQLKNQENGVYVFLIEGESLVAGELLKRRDGMEVSDSTSISIEANTDSKILLMEVPFLKN